MAQHNWRRRIKRFRHTKRENAPIIGHAVTQWDDKIRESIDAGYCPDCGHRGFTLGPMGGASINIECGNIKCLARFNVVRHIGFIVIAQRIEKRSEGGSDNWGYTPR